MKIATIIFILISFILNPLQAQDVKSDFNSYFSYSLSYRLNKKIKLHAGQLLCFNNNPYEFQYNQMKFGASYRFSKKISVDLYVKPMLFKGTIQSKWYNRLSTTISHRAKIFSLPLKNSITAEWHFPQLKKYRYRFIYTLKYSFKNKVLPLRATPYIKYQLYYYLGGRPMNYYDEAGDVLLARQAPNDFHRFRLGAGVRFRPFKKFYVTLYYIWQQEFNTTFTKNRKLNILNKSQTKIKYPFNDYQVLGLSLSYSITKKKKKKHD
ncbi:MAG TPA: DUF2490 domain-containing protein [Phaeodactylibacter sp.]|nr:DUF2490 domain-containing protein [Phaeodactylibacter sp.]